MHRCLQCLCFLYNSASTIVRVEGEAQTLACVYSFRGGVTCDGGSIYGVGYICTFHCVWPDVSLIHARRTDCLLYSMY